MRTIILVLSTVLLLVTPALFAEPSTDVGVTMPATAQLWAHATTKAGVDLDNKFFAYNTDVGAWLIMKFTDSPLTRGTEDDGGSIEFTNLKISMEGPAGANEKTGGWVILKDLTAKVTLGDFYLKLAPFQEPKTAYQRSLDQDSDNAVTEKETFFQFAGRYGSIGDKTADGNHKNAFGFTKKGTSINPLDTVTGVELGYQIPGFLGFTVWNTSDRTTWAKETANQKAPLLETKFDLAYLGVDKLEASIGAILSTKEESDIGFGAKVGYDAGPVKPFIGADLMKPGKGGSMPLGVVAGAKVTALYGVGLAGGFQYDRTGDYPLFNALATATIDKIMPIDGQYLRLGAQLEDLTGVSRMTQIYFVGLETPVDDTLKLIIRGSVDNKASIDWAAFAKARLELTKVISRTALALQYDSNDLLNKTDGYQKLGQLVAEVTVTF